LFCFVCGAEDGSQGLAHSRQVLYHRATSTALQTSFFVVILEFSNGLYPYIFFVCGTGV
jgi:hypothetical protein